MLDKTPPDIPSGIVISVDFRPALQTLELITITGILVREPTLPVTAPLTRVLRCNIIHVNTVLFGFVRDVTLEGAERPLLELRGVRDALTDNGLRHAVEVVRTPPSEPTADALDGEVR